MPSLKRRLDAESVHRPYQDTDVVTQHLAKNLADLTHLALAPYVVPELGLHHGEDRFGASHLFGGCAMPPHSAS